MFKWSIFISTHRMYMITPRDHMSHDLSYFSGPRTSGAETDRERVRKKNTHWNANQIWVPPPNLAWYIYLIRFKMPQLNIKPTKEKKKKKINAWENISWKTELTLWAESTHVSKDSKYYSGVILTSWAILNQLLWGCGFDCGWTELQIVIMREWPAVWKNAKSRKKICNT